MASLMKDFLDEDIQQAIAVLVKLSVLRVPVTPVENYISFVQSGETAKIADIFEILDNMVPLRDREVITPLLEHIPLHERCLAGERFFDDLPQNLDTEVLNFIQSPNEWR